MRSGAGLSVHHRALSSQHDPTITLEEGSIFSVILPHVMVGEAKVAWRALWVKSLGSGPAQRTKAEAKSKEEAAPRREGGMASAPAQARGTVPVPKRSRVVTASDPFLRHPGQGRLGAPTMLGCMPGGQLAAPTQSRVHRRSPSARAGLRAAPTKKAAQPFTRAAGGSHDSAPTS